MLRYTFVLFLLLLSSLPARADNFVVGIEDLEYLPYYRTEQGVCAGFAKDLLDAFAKDSGHQMTCQPKPVKRLLSDFLQDNIDFKFPDNKHWASADKQGKNIKYSKPVVGFTDGVMVTAANKGKGADALHSIAAPRGFTPFVFLGDIKAGKVRLSEADSLEATLLMAKAGRVDGAFVNVLVAQQHMEKMMGEPGVLVYDDGLAHDSDSYYLSSIKHPEVIEQFDTWMASHTDKVAKIKQKWGIP